MNLRFACDRCGREYAAPEALAGRQVRCRECQEVIRVPGQSAPAVRTNPPMRFGPTPVDSAPLPGPRFDPIPREPRDGSGFGIGWLFGGVAALGILLLFAAALVWMLMPSASSSAGDRPTVAVRPVLPPFPEPGPAVELEPGVVVHEVRFASGSPLPGHSGKLWLYLPDGEIAPHSLPCVMITAAGSNLLTGNDLGDGSYREEHLPYVRAGFAVLAFELDGTVSDAPSDEEFRRAYETFRAARAGLVNAEIALEYLLARVPEVDPARIYVAGHSSAATLALLFAEHEPRLAGCLAYAPATDLEARFGSATLRLLSQALPEVREFVAESSPRNHAAALTCPVFLFHAEDDSNVPIAQTRAFADQLRSLGKSVTLETVPTGDHYDAMIEQGIPRGIAWLQSLPTVAPR